MTTAIEIDYYRYGISSYDGRWASVKALYDELQTGNDIWYEVTDGARAGTIGKVIEPSLLLRGSTYARTATSAVDNIHIVDRFDMLVGDKVMKVIFKNYTKYKFLIGYTGDAVTKFTKGQPVAKVLVSPYKDMLGSSISVGDWVIYHQKHSDQPYLGKITRFSKANNAWASATDRNGTEYEVMTTGCLGLIRVHMTEEFNATFQLCGDIKSVPCRLQLDLAI